jgi:hypothetical protein
MLHCLVDTTRHHNQGHRHSWQCTTSPSKTKNGAVLSPAGVLQIEAMAQLGGLVMLNPDDTEAKGAFFFGGIDGVRWRKPVVPGDTLVRNPSRTGAPRTATVLYCTPQPGASKPEVLVSPPPGHRPGSHVARPNLCR